jgi:TetR/AcrR family transcriptional repressor of mexCD-oprJ operon
MADIADQAGVGRATVYRHFPTRESLLRGVAETGANELADALCAANLDELPVDRAIARLTSVFLRTGLKYAALIGRMEEPPDPAAKERVVQPLRDVLARGVRDGSLRTDLPADLLFEMFGALLERALRLTIDEATTPEAAAEAVVTMFLAGARC